MTQGLSFVILQQLKWQPKQLVNPSLARSMHGLGISSGHVQGQGRAVSGRGRVGTLCAQAAVSSTH